MSQEDNQKESKKLVKEGEKVVVGKVVGRDKKVIPSEEVLKLAQIGCKDIEIAKWFGIDGNTLRYNFSVELLKGRESLKHSLRRAQIKLALSGNATMLIWLGKQQLDQAENPINAEDKNILPWIDEPIEDE